jgi:hypothetical protein
VHTVELLPDPGLDAAVRRVWQHLAAAGLPSLAGHPHATNRPHLTLGSAPELPPLDTALAGLPVAVRLAGVLAFPGRRSAVAWAVVPTQALLDLHGAVADALGSGGDGQDGGGHLHPGRWTPHISLALRLTAEERAAAVALLGDLPEAAGELVAARTYDGTTRTVRPLP